MKMVPNRRLRIDRATFEEGQEYNVDTSIAVRAVNNGWATSPDYSGSKPEQVTPHIVRPDDAIQGVGDTSGGA